jgi:hypothetical protein
MADRPDMAGANFCPFCRRAIRSGVGVDPAKNFSQLALIVAVALPLAPVEPDDVLEAAAVGLDAGVDELELGLELLEQAVIEAASTRPSAGTRNVRPAPKRNRILAPPTVRG